MNALALVNYPQSDQADVEQQVISSIQKEAEIALATLAVEMANQLGVSCVAASFFPGSSEYMDGVQVGDMAYVPYGGALCASVLNFGGVRQLYRLDKDPSYADSPGIASVPFVRSFIGSAIRGRKSEVIGIICAFSSSDLQFSDEHVRAVASYDNRAAATLEVFNTSESLKAVVNTQSCVGKVDYLARLGYEEAANHLLSLIHDSAPRIYEVRSLG